MWSSHFVKFCDENKYILYRKNGQMIVLLKDENIPRPDNAELFFAKIPTTMSQERLFQLFQKVGRIFEIRLLMHFNGLNRGYGFVTYASEDDASNAIHLLDGAKLDRRPIVVKPSCNNCRLFVSRVPMYMENQKIEDELRNIFTNLKQVFIPPPTNGSTYNRGYLFLEFNSHKDAAYSRFANVYLEDQRLNIDWAYHIPEIKEPLESDVTTLFISNLRTPDNAEELASFLRYHVVERLNMKNMIIKEHYAFLQFDDRESAAKCLRVTREYDFKGYRLDARWAIPNKYITMVSHAGNGVYCKAVPMKIRLAWRRVGK